MHEYELQQSREYQAAKDLENALNNMSWRPEVFAKSVRTYHRTLQQSLFRTIVAVIREMAASDYGVDLRNQGSHDTYDPCPTLWQLIKILWKTIFKH